jgi:hypothetical protein
MGDAEAAARAGRGNGAAAGMRVFSPEYYALCAGGGMLAAGATHLAITPLDVLKVNMQVSGLAWWVGCSRCSLAALPCGVRHLCSAAASGCWFGGLYCCCYFSMLCEFGFFQQLRFSGELDMLGVH